MTNSDKVPETPPSGKSETPAADEAGRRERDSLTGKEGPSSPSNDLERGTKLDSPGPALGSGGPGGGNVGVDTSVGDKLSEGSKRREEEEKERFRHPQSEQSTGIPRPKR